MAETTAATTSSPFIKDIATITESDDELRAILLDAELPPMLPALAYATGDLSLLRENLRPDPLLFAMPQGGLTEEQQAEVELKLSDKVSMCNFWANRLCCEAADQAMQVHGGMGYSRHKPFEHIYRHHRRYRITEGSEEIQKRKVAGFLFGYMGEGKR